MARKYYWLKLSDDFFKDKTIKKLRKIAGGDTYTIIYLKMLLKAIRQENKLFFEGIEENFADELALDLEEDEENVKVTLSFLQKRGLLQLVDETEYYLTEGAKMTGSETESAARMRLMRERKASLCDNDVTGKLRNSDDDVIGELQGVTLRDKKVTLEKEIEKEIDNNIVSDDTIRRTEIQRVVDAWNQIGVNPVSKMMASSTRYKMISARIREYGIDDVLKAIENIKQSEFLRGRNKSGWSISFEWFARPNNFPKVLEGQYNDHRQNDIEQPGENDQWQ